ncbi:hypothetical protein LCGC14_2282770, partial [marine sediment metagenome]
MESGDESQQAISKMKENKIRDDLIRTLYKPGLGGTIGRAQKPPISRQRVFQIVSE